MQDYKCRVNSRNMDWQTYRAGDPALAAQLFAEDPCSPVDDNTEIDVEGHGKYLASFRVVITKAS